jgi:hypothetical protein
MLGNNSLRTDLYCVHKYSYILCQPNDGLSGRSMLVNQQWNKQLLYLTGFTLIVNLWFIYLFSQISRFM